MRRSKRSDKEDAKDKYWLWHPSNKNKSMEGKHTPLPWVVKKPGTIVGHKNTCAIQNDNHFDWVATVQVSNVPEWEANAEIIVEAVNNYAQLQSELEKAKELIKMAQNLTAGTSKESFERFDRFMKQSTAFLEGSGNKTK